MNDDKMFFDFTHSSEDGNWTFTKNYDYGTKWSTVLTDFLSFMSGVYGYNLHEKVNYSGDPSTTYLKGEDKSEDEWEDE